MRSLANQPFSAEALVSFFGANAEDLTAPLLDALPVGVYVCDAAGRVVRYNRMAAELWGRAPELGERGALFCGCYRLHSLDGAHVPHARCPMVNVLANGEPLRDQEIIIERPDRSRIVALVNIEPLKNAAGEVVGAVNVFRDNSKQQEVEIRLRSSERRYRAIFDNAQVSVWEKDISAVQDLFDDLRAAGVHDLRAYLKAHPDKLRDVTSLMRVKGVNAYTLQLFEAESAEALAAAPEEVLTEASLPALIEEFVAIWEGKRRFDCETVLQTRKGRHLDVVISAAFEGERLENCIVSVHDVSRRKASEMAAQRLAAIVESSGDAIVAKNLDGVIESWNRGAERLFGYTAEEAVGQSILILIPEDRRDEEGTIIGRVRRGLPVEHYETVRRRKDGSLVNISLTVSPIKSADGTVIGASKIARDITERVEASEQQQLLLREMNHRIKNLITLSSGLVSLSARSATTAEELADSVKQRFAALARAHDLILPRAGDVGCNPGTATSLHALIRTIVSPHDHGLEDAPQRFVVSGDDASISGRAATGFALLFHEFATNAAKYGALSAMAGRVEVVCTVEGSDFVVEWRERDGPPVAHRDGKSNGFGSLLSRATIEGQLRGKISRQWNPEGLVIRLAVPRERLGV